jgi:hypothetical protein
MSGSTWTPSGARECRVVKSHLWVIKSTCRATHARQPLLLRQSQNFPIRFSPSILPSRLDDVSMARDDSVKVPVRDHLGCFGKLPVKQSSDKQIGQIKVISNVSKLDRWNERGKEGRSTHSRFEAPIDHTIFLCRPVHGAMYLSNMPKSPRPSGCCYRKHRERSGKRLIDGSSVSRREA